MHITLTINNDPKSLDVQPHERLLRVLHRLGYYSVKFGDEHSLIGAGAQAGMARITWDSLGTCAP